MEDLHPAARYGSSGVSILLDDMAYVVQTAATATPIHACLLQIEEEPSSIIMSRIFFYCPLNSYRMARVIHAEGPFILLRAHFASQPKEFEYFLFNGNGRSLDRVPHPTDLHQNNRTFGILPCHDDHGGNYLLLALGLDHRRDDYYPLHIYSSEDKTWSTKHLFNPCPSTIWTIVADKVITLGDGKLGFLDSNLGMLVFNPSRPTADFIPLPNLLPGNSVEVEDESCWPARCCGSWFRDLCLLSNGVIKLVEVEHCLSVTRIFRHEAPSNNNEDYDSDLMARRGTYIAKYHLQASVDGWRVVTWTRSATSSNCWSNKCILDLNDITVDGASLLMSGINFSPRNLYPYFPTLSADGDVVYFRAVEKYGDEEGWVLALHLGTKTMKALGRRSFQRHESSERAFRSYAAALEPSGGGC